MLKDRGSGSKISFIDGHFASHQAILLNGERAVEDYIIHVMEKSKSEKDELILWPFNKK